MIKVVANVEREPGEKNFSCHMNVEAINTGVLGVGPSAKAAMDDMISGWNDVEEYLREGNKEIPVLDIQYRFDVGSLFSYYNFLNIAGVAKEIGINPSVMRQYAIGVRKPSEERKTKIQHGFVKLAEKMRNAALY